MKQHQILIEAFEKKGYALDNNLLTKEGYQDINLIDGTVRNLINKASEDIFDDKFLLKQFLKSTKINIPSAFEISSELDDFSLFMEVGKKYVCKPSKGTEGEGIQLHIETPNQVKDYIKKYLNHYKSVLLEEQIDFKDLRIQVLDSKIIAACIRVPAFVTGDGKQTLSQLIDNRIKEMEKENPNNQLVIDSKLIPPSLNAVIEDGKDIQLNELANMSQGAIAIDITDTIHPLYNEWIQIIAEQFKTGFFAVDILTNHPEKDPTNYSYLLEINARPEWLHHTFSKRKQHNIASMIVDLF